MGGRALASHQAVRRPTPLSCLRPCAGVVRRHPNLATDVIYVAGDRVVTDALCKPFSMGRNLFCVHSKKHIEVRGTLNPWRHPCTLGPRPTLYSLTFRPKP